MNVLVEYIFFFTVCNGEESIKRKQAAVQPPAPDAAQQANSDKALLDFELTWECPNCGQFVFGKHPPDMCDYCGDLTTWRLVVKSPR